MTQGIVQKWSLGTGGLNLQCMLATAYSMLQIACGGSTKDVGVQRCRSIEV